MKNLLSKDSQQLILEGLLTKYINKHKGELKIFINKMKEQFKHNKQARDILLAYSKSGTLTPEQSSLLKDIAKDMLKIVGLGGIVVLPGGSLLMVFILKLAKFLKLDVIPSKFKETEKTED